MFFNCYLFILVELDRVLPFFSDFSFQSEPEYEEMPLVGGPKAYHFALELALCLCYSLLLKFLHHGS